MVATSVYTTRPCEESLFASRRTVVRTPREIFGTFFSLKVLVSLVLAGCASVLSVLLPAGSGAGSALVLFAGGMFFQSLNTALNVTFQAWGKLYLGSLNNLLMAVLSLGIGITFMLFSGRVMALGLAYIMAMSASFLVNYKVFERHIHRLRVGELARWRELGGNPCRLESGHS